MLGAHSGALGEGHPAGGRGCFCGHRANIDFISVYCDSGASGRPAGVQKLSRSLKRGLESVRADKRPVSATSNFEVVFLEHMFREVAKLGGRNGLSGRGRLGLRAKQRTFVN